MTNAYIQITNCLHAISHAHIYTYTHIHIHTKIHMHTHLHQNVIKTTSLLLIFIFMRITDTFMVFGLYIDVYCTLTQFPYREYALSAGKGIDGNGRDDDGIPWTIVRDRFK